MWVSLSLNKQNLGRNREFRKFGERYPCITVDSNGKVTAVAFFDGLLVLVKKNLPSFCSEKNNGRNGRLFFKV